ncbi:flavin-containing monooxygenase [Streptomyces abikoensis]|uniref:flavin-containing monooxygenase n=1 Tax=Streptomyces abikoensis TaxID=97398 RepID=UPI00369AB375
MLIIGAGLSGIGVACHLRRALPDRDFAILEHRDGLGGTWDVFRYPGIRSDSDMFSFGYEFRPWNELKVLADGESIRDYVAATADEYGIDESIHYGLEVLAADWSSERQQWTVTALREGTRIHPQHWPQDFDHTGKEIVVIGSGATAVTLVPAMADKAEHVTMLQCSPSYVFSLPTIAKFTAWQKKFLPDPLVHRMTRRRDITLQRAIFKASRRFPRLIRRLLLAGVRRGVGEGFDMTHFSPKYNLWDERLCAVPDGDLFKALREGRASVVTDTIETFTATGIKLASGRELEADVIVTATGLRLQALGGTSISKVDRAANGTDDGVVDELSSGYIRRAKDIMPRQGRDFPWRMVMDYKHDKKVLLSDPIEDGILQFSGATAGTPVPA